MPFGDTAKKIQQLSNAAEELYGKMNEMREQLQSLKERVEKTDEAIGRMDRELDEQRVILEAIAEEHDIDVEGLVAELEEAETEGEADATDQTPDDAGAGTQQGAAAGSETASQSTGSSDSA